MREEHSDGGEILLCDRLFPIFANILRVSVGTDGKRERWFDATSQGVTNKLGFVLGFTV